ncbi:unnamed protein product, partial [Ectocarpus fasciculatus]
DFVLSRNILPADVAEASSRSRALFAWESDHLLLGVGRNLSVRESRSDERQRDGPVLRN